VATGLEASRKNQQQKDNSPDPQGCKQQQDLEQTHFIIC
jgi:hypothetical protein